MAVDSAQKRYSMLNFGTPWCVPLFETDGAVDADDRLHLLGLYSGIAADAPSAVTPIWIWTGVARSRTDTAAARSRTDTAAARSMTDTGDEANRMNQ